MFHTVNTQAAAPKGTTIRFDSHLSRTSSTPGLWIRVALVFTFLFMSSAAHAAKSPIYTSFLNNKAAGGYDVVSYFQGDGTPVKGRSDFQHDYKGADWYFSSADNLAAFKQDPEKYAPQYGGYCAYALASGDTVKGDPLEYHVHEDKLYLNINAKYRKIWLGDKINYIVKGDGHWPSALD